MNIQVQEEKRGEVLLMKVRGTLDSNTSPTFEEKILEKVNKGENLIAFDFSRIDFISSAGLRVFLVVAKKLKKSSGKTALYGMSENIREVFDITGFSTIIPIFSSEQEAMKSFS